MGTTAAAAPVSHARLDVNPRRLPDMVAGAIIAHRDEAEAIRRLPPALLEVLRSAGLFRLQTPVELGGFEAELTTVLAVYEELARLDGSVAWNVWNANIGLGAGFMTKAGAAVIWGAGPDPVIVNSARPAGGAIPTDGGYRLSGRWDIVSAIDSADWVVLFGIVMGAEGPVMVTAELPDVRSFYVPKRDVTVLDTWHVGGMRGSGSNTVVVDDAFVPEALAPSPFGSSRIDRPAFRIPIFTSIASGAAAACLGIARSAIDEIIALAPTKATGAGCMLSALPSGQGAIASADAQLRAAHLLLHDAAGDLCASAVADSAITVAQRGRIRAAMTHAALTSRSVVNAMYELGSSSSLYSANRLERIFRDGNAAAQHGLLNPLTFVAAGRILLGMDSGVVMF